MKMRTPPRQDHKAGQKIGQPFLSAHQRRCAAPSRDATEDDVADALAEVRLDIEPGRLVGELGTALSGGEQRRLGLSRLVVGDAQVLVLDEPSEHLDPETADALLYDVWAQASDKPLLVITHDPAVVARCDRVVHLG